MCDFISLAHSISLCCVWVCWKLSVESDLCCDFASFLLLFLGHLLHLQRVGFWGGGALKVIDCLRVYRFIGKCRYSRTTADVYVWARVDKQLDAGTDPQTGPISCLCHGSEWKGDFLSLLCIVLYCLNSHILTLFEINIPPPNLFLFTFLSGFEGSYTYIRHHSVVQYATHKQ